jgi:hypothetical protein
MGGVSSTNVYGLLIYVYPESLNFMSAHIFYKQYEYILYKVKHIRKNVFY